MCGVSLRERKTNAELRKSLGIKDTPRWMGHVLKKDKDDWVRSMEMVIEVRGVGRPRIKFIHGFSKFFFGRFIYQFSKIIEPLNRLRKQNVPFIWTQEQDLAFHKLKLALSSKPVIQPFDVNKDITLTTDTSEKPIAGIFMRERPRNIF